MPGTVLSQHQAVQPVGTGHDLDAVRHDLPGGQRVTGTAVGGADAVADGDAAELHRGAPCPVDAVFHLLAQLPQVFVTGHDVREGIADADDGAGEIVVGETVGLI